MPRAPDRPRRFELLVHQAAAEGLLSPIRVAELLDAVPAPSRGVISRASLEAAVASAAASFEDESITEWVELEPGE